MFISNSDWTEWTHVKYMSALKNICTHHIWSEIYDICYINTSKRYDIQKKKNLCKKRELFFKADLGCFFFQNVNIIFGPINIVNHLHWKRE